jgi:hypothetical protein
MRNYVLVTILAAVALAVGACDAPPPGHHRGHLHEAPAHALHVQSYREKRAEPRHGSVDTFDPTFYYVYWYVINDTDRARTSYYYESRTPVTNFSSVTFTRSAGGLPKNVQEELEQAEKTEEVELEPAQEPAQIEADETAEVSETAGVDSPTDTGPSDVGQSATESTSTDSGGSSDGGAGSD